MGLLITLHQAASKNGSSDVERRVDNFSPVLDHVASGELDVFETPPSSSPSDDEERDEGELRVGAARRRSGSRTENSSGTNDAGTDSPSGSHRRTDSDTSREGNENSLGALGGRLVLDGIANLSNSIVSSTTASYTSISLNPPLSSPLASPGSGVVSPGKLMSKYKLELKSPRKTVMKTRLYEPPDLDKALAHMDGFRPHLCSEQSTRQSRGLSSGGSERGRDDSSGGGGGGGDSGVETLRLILSGREMRSVFSAGVCFWFIVLRDYFVIFFAFTLVSIPFFRLAAVANYRSDTSAEQLGGLSRASMGAILLYGDAKAKTGAVTDTDRNNALFIVCLDAINMLALMACLLYTSPSPRDATLSRMPSSA